MLICVTNRLLCRDDFYTRLDLLASSGPDAIMLREKDLPITDYTALAERVQAICQRRGVRLIINQNIETALRLKIPFVHLALPDLRIHHNDLKAFTQVGASVHSRHEAVEAKALGAHYVLAGHIFATACKEGVPPRGPAFLEDVCAHVDIPVWAIGGITPQHAQAVIRAGAKGVAVMNEAMTCCDPAGLKAAYDA